MRREAARADFYPRPSPVRLRHLPDHVLECLLLTGSTKEQCFFSCYGHGGNGKTTYLEITGYLMGDYSATLPFDALEAKRYGGVPNEGMKLYGMRFVRSVETREGKALDESRIKAWTGSDSVSARPLYKDWFEFCPTHKLWL